jgi:protein gp37
MIENCPQHTFQILTKRPERMIEFFDWYIARNSDHSVGLQWSIPDNIWLGVSCENQAMADKRIPLLMQIPAKVRFLSCEPLLEPINLSKFLPIEWSEIAEDWIESWPGIGSYSTDYPNWIIVGLESGSNARRCDLQAVHSIINQCQTAKVKVFCKQLGTVWAKESGTYKQDRKGASPELWDKSFNVQEFPNC